MGMGMPAILQLLKLCLIGCALVVQGSTDSNISPSPATLSSSPPIEGTPGPDHHRKSWRSNAPSSLLQPNGSDSHHPPLVLHLPPPSSAPVPQMIQGLVTSLPTSTPTSSPSYSTAPPPLNVLGHVPSMLPSAPQGKIPVNKTPVAVNKPIAAPATPTQNLSHNSPIASQRKTPVNKIPALLPVTAPVPVAAPSRNLPQYAPSAPQRKTPVNKAPISKPVAASVPVASPSQKFPSAPPMEAPVVKSPVSMPVTAPVPVATPLMNLPRNSPISLPSIPGTLSPSSHQRSVADSMAPIPEPVTPVSTESPPLGRYSSAVRPSVPEISPFPLSVPVAAPSQNLPQHAPSAPQRKTPVNKAPISKPVAASVPVASPSQKFPSAPPMEAPVVRSPVSMPVTAPVPVATPLTNLPRNSPISLPSIPGTLSPSSHQRSVADNMAPIPEPVTPVPVAAPSQNLPQHAPSAPQRKTPDNKAPTSKPVAASVPVASPSQNLPSAPPREAPIVKSPVSMPVRAPVPVATPSQNLPSASPREAPVVKSPVSMPATAPVPVATPTNFPRNSPISMPSMPGTLSPSSHQRNAADNMAPIPEPVTPAPAISPSSKLPENSPTIHPFMPGKSPSILPDPDASPASTPQSIGWQRDRIPEAAPPHELPTPVPIVDHSSAQSPSSTAPSTHTDMRHNTAPAPSLLSPKVPSRKGHHSPTPSPSTSNYKYHHTRNKNSSPAPGSLYPVSSPTSKQQGPSPTVAPSTHTDMRHNNAPAPSLLSPKVPSRKGHHSSAPSLSTSNYKHHHTRNKNSSPASASLYPVSPSTSKQQGPSPTAPSTHTDMRHNNAPAPSLLSPKVPSRKGHHSPTPSPSTSNYKHHHTRNKNSSPAPASLYPVSPTSKQQGPSPTVAPSTHTDMRHNNAPAPSLLSPIVPSRKGHHSPAPSPSISNYKHHHTRNKNSSPTPASLYPVSPLTSKQQAPGISPALVPIAEQAHHAPPPSKPVPQSQYPFPSPMSNVSPAPSLPPKATSGHTKVPFFPPNVSPGSSAKSPKMPPLLPPLQAFPPPPPNLDCSTTICTEPYTNTPPEAPCACVLPMQVGLSLSVALYTFFPLVSELAKEIATGVFMKQSQVRIIGANAASQQPEKTIVLIELVPLGDKFDNPTALLTFQRFWHKQVVIKASYFDDYEVLYVRYPGLPPSPPSSTGITIIDGGPYPGIDNNARANKPLGVDVRKNGRKDGLGGGIIAIIALSASVTVVLCFAVAWVLIFKHRNHVPGSTLQAMPPSLIKPSGLAGSLTGSGPSSVSLSFGSSIAPYTGSAKTFSTSEIEKATDNLDDSRVLGEGGFGRVYSGVLEDGTKVAVKVLKRADQQGGREFLAEVEMLSRLHHRNLVKLIGICTEERTRCLVYELIPNGSVESHLHGIDKETAPLNWASRVKIALGAARGLAYLHEDSSPRVIHRDFKSSNILLEHDFTPKVSDFGLARTALDEENRHISTRVMGTFGYVAPEYAMTGHLLVKSDVYSYGVVLLELLTGRKPVDMSQPPGQENLVAWARPLLISKEGLETIIDTSLGSDISFDSIAKVAAIASMCVQPEVSHRPFMGEVVQALKLVCNECDDARAGSKSSSHEDLSIDMDTGVSTASGHLPDRLLSQYQVPNFNSGIDTERGLSVSDLFSSARFGRQEFGSFRRYSSSGPLRTGRGRHFWEKIRRLSGGSVSEHGGATFRLWPGSH